MGKRPDPRQFDMFAAIASVPATVDSGARLTGDGITFEECDRRRLALQAAERDRNAEIETLMWNVAKRDGSYWFSIPHGKPGLIIKLWQIEPGRWITALSTSFGTGGSLSGFYHGSKGHPTREAALLAIAVNQVRSAARMAATGGGWEDSAKEAKQRRRAVDWFAEMLPPLIAGVDLIAEFVALVPVYEERNRLRLEASARGEKEYTAEDGQIRSIYAL